MKTFSGTAEPRTPVSVGVAAGQIAQFFIPATASLHERRPRTLKHADTFAVFDHNGDALSGPGSPEGLFHRDTRHLSHFYLTIGGLRPILLSSTLRNDNATLTCDLTNPDLYDENNLLIEHDVIHIRRSRFLWKATCYERLVVRNFDVSPRTVRLELQFGADFADMFEVRGTRRERKGEQHPANITEDGIHLSYTGLDGKTRTTNLQFDPTPAKLLHDRAQFELTLQPREARSLFVEIRCGLEGRNYPPRHAFFGALRDARRSMRLSSSRAAAISSSNELFNEAIRRSISDVYMLVTNLPEGPYPYAGIPWFSTVFGRDGLITAWETLWADPQIARGVLLHLAADQATTIDPAADAEPGKILHETRQGEMAELREVPFKEYYGSIDSTPLFIMLAGAYLQRTDEVETLRQLWPNIEAALHWIEQYGDIDGDGFVEYRRRTPEGLINQGWKDSQDSVFHADGTLAQGPIALVEVQAYVYGAYQAASEIAKTLGRAQKCMSLAEKAASFRKQFDAAFFDEELGTYILALDGEKEPCRVRTSNAGHALFTGIALDQRVSALVETLMRPASFSGWGIRTLAGTEARFNPMSYHNGSVWPHDNAIIAAGLARYGYRHEVAQIFTGLFEASTHIDLRRLPELFCGFARQRTQGPTLYPVACSPQAWAAAAPVALVQSCLGLHFEPAKSRVVFDRPMLPEFMDELTLRGVSIGGGSVDVAIRRSADQVVVEVLERRGQLRVLINA
jgi:glycogen debranching enzyme